MVIKFEKDEVFPAFTSLKKEFLIYFWQNKCTPQA